ncbi:MAG: cystathionine gamma-synthase [Bacteroidetes bacterium]|nr:cystathionine gamma-synthase [Rhodothermia bacterium]MCS7155581.1 cystathionine gamma-synthase [Bacteroidota bacterium]MCX7906439.1 cystathionine gamma-synthase [Bacteroidota bacterium]MDW8137279.1 cystathionine gamma-synthase [Bacteroidota bacterium]MDW8284851.1 cystathionine gamma-synthase [Bacteroidota bacterium]
MQFATKAVHAGQRPDPTTGAIMTPIYQTSTYVQEAPGVHKGYAYARVSNPTRTALEENLAALEEARFAAAFASGCAAIDAILRQLNPGDHVIATDDLYGGTYRLFRTVYERFGITFGFVDMTDPAALEAAWRPNTRLIWVETPTNPLLKLIDIAAIAQIARARGAVVVVDNTFATPYLQNPLTLGADLVVHSATKYLGGHSDVIGGAVMTNDERWIEGLRFQQKTTGAVPGPMDCFLVLRGVKTLHVRMERHCQNAQLIAEFLAHHPKVASVRYPGLSSHPQHELARRQMRGFGGMVSFTLRDDSLEAAIRVLSSTKLFALAESLGGVESLIGHPATMTHAAIPRQERIRAGLTDSLIRLSVGIEDAEDLIRDLDEALSRA